MSWVVAGVAAGTALMSMMQAQQQQKNQRAQNLAAAEQTRYSPWTNLGAGQIEVSGQNPVLAGVGGGLQGAVAGYGMKQNKMAADRSNAQAEQDWISSFKKNNGRAPTEDELKGYRG